MSNNNIPQSSRRVFIKGLAASLAATSSGMLPSILWAGSTTSKLSGTEFFLNIGEHEINITGKKTTATLVNDSLPAPTLHIKEGDDITIHVTNNLPEMCTIHWHGIILDSKMDGVPGISFPGISPGETFIHRFKVKQNGTYWYHAHTLAEQTGVYGALIVEAKDRSNEEKVDRDYPVVLSDWTDENPVNVFLNLKKMGGYYNYQQLTTKDFFDDIANVGLSRAMEKRKPWNKARMSPTDYSDVTASTYTYLMNGHSPTTNWHGLAKAGEKIRLRFIGAMTGSFFDVRIPGLKLKIVSTDGQDVEAVMVDEFRIGPGETYDLIVEIPDEKAYTIFAQSMERSGYARGTLSARPQITSLVPEMDERILLTLKDMMGAMADTKKDSAMSMNMAAKNMPKKDLSIASKKVRHARTEYGAGVDMRVDMPRYNLDDPGPGLRNNGRRVLTYADLKSLHKLDDERIPSREIEIHLTGNMERFIWSMDGLKLNEAKPIHFPLGERIRIILHNDSNMLHPMHLHGMWSDLESPDGGVQVRKHTITVQPAQRVSFLVTVDAPGRWAFHCHLLYHMAAGMFREVIVA